jgi:hypothetical protein
VQQIHLFFATNTVGTCAKFVGATTQTGKQCNQSFAPATNIAWTANLPGVTPLRHKAGNKRSLSGATRKAVQQLLLAH